MQNGEIFERLTKSVNDHPEINARGYTLAQSAWQSMTRPFRTGKPLTDSQRDHILDFLGRAIKVDKYKNDASFKRAIEDLKNYRPM